MCKLCNTDRPPTTLVTNNAKRKEFQSVVMDYLNELPCEPCCRTITNKWHRELKSQSLDKYILNKLFKSYVKTNSNNQRHDYRSNSTIATIIVRKNLNSGHTSYIAKVCRSNKSVMLGTYSSLEEALSAKVNYCVEHNLTKVLSNMQTKLKELQNV